MSKVVLITGTSSGLGLSLATLLGENGYKVYASMRNLSKKEKLENSTANFRKNVFIVPLDVQDQSSIDSCVEKILDKEGRIDILINNAGAGFVKTTEQATEEEINWVFNVNALGTIRCIKSVLPSMRKHKEGRIINVSSVGGLVGQPFNEFYCAAKFAVEGYTESLSTYVGPAFNIKFSLVEPGGIMSDFVQNVQSKMGENLTVDNKEYQALLDQYFESTRYLTPQQASYLMQTPNQVAQVVLEVIENPNPPLRVRTSQWANEFCELKTQADPDGEKLKTRLIQGMENKNMYMTPGMN